MNSKFLYFMKYDDNNHRIHCSDGPAIVTYEREKNGNRRLSSVVYKLQGKTISEKAWNKKFGTNFNYKEQIELEKIFKIFGKKFKIAHVNNTKDSIHLVPYS